MEFKKKKKKKIQVYQKEKPNKTNRNHSLKTRLKHNTDVGIIREEFKITKINILRALMESTQNRWVI